MTAYVVHGQTYADATGLAVHTPNEGADAINAEFAILNARTDGIHSVLSYGGVADGVTDLATAINAIMAIANVGDTILIPPSDSETTWYWSAMVDWLVDDITLSAYGATIDMSSGTGKIRVNAERGRVFGGTYRHVPVEPLQTTSNFLYPKSGTGTGETAGDYEDWLFRDVNLINVTLRLQTMGRVNVRIPLFYSTLIDDIDSSTTVLPVRDASVYAGQSWVSCLQDSGTTDVRAISSFDATADTVTISSPFSGTALSGRRVTSVAKVSLLAETGYTIIRWNTVAPFTNGQWLSIILDTGAPFVSQILDVDTGSKELTIADALPSQASVGNRGTGVNNGAQATGTDITKGMIDHCDIGHVRANYALEIGGGRGSRIINTHVHDIVRWDTTVYDRYFAEYPWEDLSDDDLLLKNFGEAMKITAGALDAKVDGCLIERVGRNGIDLFAGGECSITNTTFRQLYNASGIETKWVSEEDLVPTAPVLISGCVFQDIPEDSYAIIAGVPDMLITDCRIDRAGSGVYVNGGRHAYIGAEGSEEEGDLVNYTDSVTVKNCRIRYVVNQGIIVTEGTNILIQGNIISQWQGYGIYLASDSISCLVVDNIVKVPDPDFPNPQNRPSIRILGTVGVDTLHVLRGNQTYALNTPISMVDATYVVINGYGEEDVGAPGSPTAAKWPEGANVRNTFDSTIWIKRIAGWTQIA